MCKMAPKSILALRYIQCSGLVADCGWLTRAISKYQCTCDHII
jgi:predicted small metal-binding protein